MPLRRYTSFKKVTTFLEMAATMCGAGASEKASVLGIENVHYIYQDEKCSCL